MMRLTGARNHTARHCNPLHICTAKELGLLFQVCKKREFSEVKMTRPFHPDKV
jgi:hypothetical protein